MNDKISAGVQGVGFCCPFAYFCARGRKHDTQKRLAKEVGVGWKAIQWNQAKFRAGTLVCLKLSICQHAVKPEEKK